jgi:16S rRNA G966 N2-methylase RsmD
MKYLRQEQNMTYDAFFVDPPYDLRIGDTVVNAIIDNGLLTDNGIIVAESATTDGLVLPENYEIFHHKIFGTTQVHFIGKKE